MKNHLSFSVLPTHMQPPTRRRMVTTLAGVSIAGVSGCLGEIKEKTPIGPNLKEKWRKNDDFPQDDFRNYAFHPSESVAERINSDDPVIEQSSRKEDFPSSITGNTGELTFGYMSTSVNLSSLEGLNHTVMSLEIKFESTSPVDVYVRSGLEKFDSFSIQEGDDLSEVEYIEQYSDFDVTNYHKIIQSNEEKEYEFIITRAGYIPSGKLTPQEMLDVSTENPISIDGWKINAYYVPFEHYKNADKDSSTRFRYNREWDGKGLG